MDSASPSAPPSSDVERDVEVEVHSVTYPMLHKMLAPRRMMMEEEVPAPSGFAFNAWNNDCLFCRVELGSMTDAVALLPCGHAFHVACGEGFLWRDSRQACPQANCAGARVAPAESAKAHDTGPITAAGALTQEELDDPVVRRYLMRQQSEAVAPAKLAYASKEVHSALFGASETPSEIQCRLRKKWEGEHGEAKMDLRLKAQLLLPYLTKVPKKARQIDGNVTLNDLLDLEAEAEAVGKAEKATREKRISFRRFADDLGLSALDMFFLLDMRSWNDLTDVGFVKDDLTPGNDSDFSVRTLSALYDLDNHNFVRDLGIDIDDLLKLRLSAETMRMAGFTFDALDEHFQITKEDVMRFDYRPDEWHHALGLKKRYLFRPLELNATDLRLLKWNPIICTRVFGLNERDQDELGITELLTNTSHAPSARRRAPVGQRVADDSSSSDDDDGDGDEPRVSVASRLRTALAPRPMMMMNNGHRAPVETAVPNGRRRPRGGPVVLSLS